MFTESRFHEILNELTGPTPDGVTVGVGDDAAVLAGDPGAVIAADMILDGVDFHLSHCGYHAAAIKAIRKNISDLAAMGARPAATFCSVALPPDITEREARELLVGLTGEAKRHGCPLLGGDTKRSTGPLILAVTLLGQMEGRTPLTRDGARPGDLLFVTGPLGGSGRGRHLTPPVRVDVGVALAARGDVHAAMDLSDGLSRDLSRMCAASGVGAVVDAVKVPIHEDAIAAGGSALEHALHDGEDFELLFALPAAAADGLAGDPILGPRCHLIGRVAAASAGLTLATAGVEVPMEIRGFEHRFGDAGVEGSEP